MLEHHVSAKITQKRLYAGPAANHVDDFSDWLHARGYKKRTVFRCFNPSQRGPIGSPRLEELLETLPKGCRSV